MSGFSRTCVGAAFRRPNKHATRTRRRHRRFHSEARQVLIVIEGRAAGEALGRKIAPVDAAIVGIVDHVDVSE